MGNRQNNLYEQKPIIHQLLFDAQGKPRSWVPTSVVSLIVLLITLASNSCIYERQNRVQILKLIVEQLPLYNAKAEICKIKLEKEVQSLAHKIDKNYGNSSLSDVDPELIKTVFSECKQALVAIEALMKAADGSGAEVRKLRKDLDGFQSFLSAELEVRLRASSVKGMALPYFSQTFLPIKRDWNSLVSSCLDKVKL